MRECQTHLFTRYPVLHRIAIQSAEPKAAPRISTCFCNYRASVHRVAGGAYNNAVVVRLVGLLLIVFAEMSEPKRII
jgi:hypothetical protein